jgi:hypothetical protein
MARTLETGCLAEESRLIRGLVAVAVTVGMFSGPVWAQQAGSQQTPAPAKQQQTPPAQNQPVSPDSPGVTPPQLQDGQTTVIVDKPLTKEQQKQLLADANEIFEFVSHDTGLPIEHSVKKVFITRDKVNSELRKKFDEDKSNKRMERSELVLKKFGLLDNDFNLRPFLLSLLTEQIAGFYDNKTKTMNLLDWVPIDQQKPVMAHELTHALQDQKVGLNKWEDLEPDSVAKNVDEDTKHIQTDETDTAREAVLEGQAMVSFADYMLKPSGKTLKDVPQVGEQLVNGAGDMSDSPVLARAPLILQESLLFPYTEGLRFEQAVLIKAGVQRAFTGVLDTPPNTSAEIMHPADYLSRKPEPLLALPDIHPTLEATGYEPYDVGVMGELDVQMTAELFGGKPLAEALAPEWDGGVYYAAQRKNASDADKATTKSIAILYLSRWKNAEAARSFFHVFEQQLPRQYDGLKRREADETDPGERVYSTNEGDVLLSVKGNDVWVSEGFELPTATKLREMVMEAQGVGPIRQAEMSVPERELVGGLAEWIGSFGVAKAGMRVF